MQKYCDFCESIFPEHAELGAVCHLSDGEECPADVFCDAVCDIYGYPLDEVYYNILSWQLMS